MVLHKEIINENEVVIENLLHDSSNILKTSYNHQTLQLFVTFKNGGVYYYNDVQPKTYLGLTEAESVGKYLNSVIKKDHTAVKMGSISGEPLTTLLEQISTFKQLLIESKDKGAN